MTMKCLRTLGVLSLTISIVCGMTSETNSTRYLEDSSSFRLGLPIPFAKKSVNIYSDLNNDIRFNSLVITKKNVSSLGTSLVQSSPDFESKEGNIDEEQGRKIRGNASKNNSFVKNQSKLDSKTSKTKPQTTTTRSKTTKRPHTKQKYKLSTLAPITIQLTKRTTTIKPNHTSSTPKSYPTSISTKKPTKPKPTIKKILTKWHGPATDSANLKQDWYEEGVPYPNPMPEITSSSPPFSISGDTVPQILSSSTTENLENPIDESLPQIEIFSNTPSEPLQGVPPILPLDSQNDDLESVAVSAEPTAAGNPISTFNLDMLPVSDLTRDPSGNPCPTVHIASSVLSAAQSRQGCSDLNLVLNTHYHQNQDTRNPGGISTYDAAAGAPEDGIVDAVQEPAVEDPGVGSVASDAGGASGGSPAGGAAGGSGGAGGDGGGNGGFKLPDLKPMFEALGYLMRGLGWLLQKLMNPWLYIIPIIIFFKLGFLGIITLFPWWIPLVFLYFSVKSEEPKNTVTHVKHHHKPVVVKHHNGWYWDQRTKSWRDVTNPHIHRSDDDFVDEAPLDDKISSFGDIFVNEKDEERIKRKFDDRSVPPPINITIENVPNPTLDTNLSTVNVLDVRTPPKVQSQIKEKISSKYSIEPSHAGVAIPVEEGVETVLEESTKKMNFYKLERPTTANGGLSTWILLSGQSTSTTKKPSIKPIIMKDEKNNETLMLSEKPLRVAKPVFNQRSTTPKPATTTSKTTTARVNTFSPSTKNTTRKPTKLTKVKASLLKGTSTTSTTAPSTTASKATTAITTTEIATTEAAATLPIEAKDGEQDLSSTSESSKKTKKSQKKKKNKNRRRKPSKSSKEGIDKLKEEESPGTQLYSYLRSEIIPVTVGVSLVGLLVTAGLASYYLQPFAALRRSDPIDRKDTDGGYYYQDSSYSNAMPEEEAIGKVIAGMPENALQENSNAYKQPTSRNTYPQNVRYRHVDRRSQIYMNPYGSVEDVKLHDRSVATTPYEGDYNDEKKFVVGSAPQEVTPAIVPEHGPRNLKEESRKFVVGNIPKEFFSTSGASPRNIRQRKRREAFPDDSENEIVPHGNVLNSKETTTILMNTETSEEVTTTEMLTTEETPKESTPHNIFNPNERPSTLFELFTDLFKLKVRLGLELIQNITNSVSTYVSTVHTRLDQHYRKASRWNQHA